MADPKKMAALAQLAQTGKHGDVFGQAQGNLAASRGAAMSGMAADADLHQAPTSVNGASPLASYQATAATPYDNFAGALTRDQSAYGAARQSQASAVDQYMAQVANARAATIAEADRAISQAQSRATATSGTGKNPLTDADTKNLATGGGLDRQQAAEQIQTNREGSTKVGITPSTGQTDETGQYYNDPDKKPTTPGEWLWDPTSNTWVNISGVDSNPAPAPSTGGATEDERKRAQAEYDRQHPRPAPADGVGGQIGQVVGNDLAREEWVKQNAGSDRLGQEADIQRRYADQVAQAAQDAQQTRLQEQLFMLPAYTRDAAMDMNLHPEFGNAGQEAYYKGMFPDMSPGDRTKAQEEYNVATTGSKNEIDAAKQRKEIDDLLGVPTGKETQSLKPEQAAKVLRVDPARVDAITNDPKWGDYVAKAEYLIKPPKDQITGLPATNPATGQPYPQIVTANDFTRYLTDVVKAPPEAVQLLVTMYRPELKG